MRFATLAVAMVIFLVGGGIGVRLLIAQPDDEAAATPTCTNTLIAKGSPLDSNVVRVNVYNASARSGLANRVTIDLQANGFLGGTIGNSTSATKPSRLAILTDDRDDPRVRLVAAQFRDKPQYAAPDIATGSGVTIIVGDGYRGLRSTSTTTIDSDRDIRVCVPTVPGT